MNDNLEKRSPAELMDMAQEATARKNFHLVKEIKAELERRGLRGLQVRPTGRLL